MAASQSSRRNAASFTKPERYLLRHLAPGLPAKLADIYVQFAQRSSASCNDEQPISLLRAYLP